MWINSIKEFLYRAIFKKPGEKEEGDDEASSRVELRHRAIDWLYLWLGAFTHLYGAATTILFFSRAGAEWPILSGLLDALQEPYLGGLGVYVVLKEVEKRRHGSESKHYGEYFVSAWMGLLFLSTLLVLLSSEYNFDAAYKIIITNSLATLALFIGGLIHRP